MSAPQHGRAALITGGLAAILASTCCLGPLVLVALGFSGAWIGNLTVLEPYRPIFIGAASVAIVLSLLPILPAPPAPAGEPVNVRIVQTNISIDQPWQESESTQRLLNEL